MKKRFLHLLFFIFLHTLHGAAPPALPPLSWARKKHCCETPLQNGTLCTFSSERLSHLIIHQRTHTQERPFKCKHCDYKAAKKNTLDRHLLTHTGEKPFVCGIETEKGKCTERFSQKGTRDRHKKTHIKSNELICGLCMNTFSRKKDLDNHMTVHSRERI